MPKPFKTDSRIPISPTAQPEFVHHFFVCLFVYVREISWRSNYTTKAMAPPELSGSAASSTTGTPAGYGRACTACQRAKCKCILRASGQDCERCHRLGKPCQPMATSRKRVAKKSTSSRTAQLEEKLEDLVTILRASQPSNGHLHSAGPGDSSPLMNSSNMGHLTSRLESLATAAASSSSSESYPHPYTVPPNYDSR